MAQARRLVGAARARRAVDPHAGAGRRGGARRPDLDYIGVGPVHATPTKPGRPAVGLDLVRYAAAHAATPFFAIGGIDTGNVAGVRAAGARRIAVVRALTESADPRAVARGAAVGVIDERAERWRSALAASAPVAGRRRPGAPPAAGPAAGRRAAGRRGRGSPQWFAPSPRAAQPIAAPRCRGPGQARAVGARASGRRSSSSRRWWPPGWRWPTSIAYVAGAKIGGSRPAASGIMVFSALMLACAVGLWRLWYGAVLGFMALLAIIVTIFALLLIEASNVLGVVVALLVILAAGYLFFKLVRVLSRIQMPKRPAPDRPARARGWSRLAPP